MKKCLKVVVTGLFLSALLGLSACGGGGGGGTPASATPPVSNTPPVANAAANSALVVAGAVVTLSGSASSDADGDPLTYRWSLTRPNGSSAVLSSTTAVSPTFTPDIAGTYVASLVVNDGKADSTASPVTVTATAPVVNVAPVADAGPDQDVTFGAIVQLDGRASSDANGDSLSYAWSFTAKPANSGSVNLISAATASPTFTANVTGIYVIKLQVNDPGGLGSSDTVTVRCDVGSVTVTW